jgi:ribosomal protein S18 acetylase RimI-like enzyme
MTNPLSIASEPVTINMVSTQDVTYRHANNADATAVAALVNSAYRGDSSRAGWTTEADLLDGTRINAEEVREQIETEESVILLCMYKQDIIGCVHLQKMDDAAYLGMFVVQPTLQGSGIGKHFMQTAETLVQELWGVKKMWMSVISVRAELIAFYERRGYIRTGRFKPFPSGFGEDVLTDFELQFEEMEKNLS